MKRTLKMITAELKAWELTIEVVPKYYRRRECKGMKQFYVKGGGINRWMGDDGEPNYSPRLCVFIAVKSVSDITFAMIRDEYRKTHGGIEIEVGLSIAKKACQLEHKEIEKRKAEYEVEEETKLARQKIKASDKELVERKEMIGVRFIDGIFNKDYALKIYASSHTGMIIADHYRSEFLILIQDHQILGMALDISYLKYPDLGDMMLRLNSRAVDLGIQSSSLGAVKNALEYLCRDFI
jgi:hypothetical protein